MTETLTVLLLGSFLQEDAPYLYTHGEDGAQHNSLWAWMSNGQSGALDILMPHLVG